ncbi:serine hydrolase [Microlunatus elymi]|uniref:Serine hydrolase n=1 Tax=Microlunatus elymi TaxID=2596828 RepID=A0A516PZE8_9ACTN|nr:serine hydrolase [Microlunatus elymi]QDP96544.1 serine hydrolase [Microlunatus elymi]
MPKSPLPRTTPESQGLNSAAIHAFLDAIDARNDLDLHSLMILRHGNVLAEGWWHPYRHDQLHLLYSLSKSFTSAAAGIAEAEGLISLDDRVVDVFAEHADVVTDDRMRELTLRQCVRMATGHREDALERAHRAAPDDLVRGFLSVPLDEEPGSIFSYNNAATFVVGAAVQKASGEDLVSFLTPRLFRPLGIERAYWQTDTQGRNLGFSGLHLTTESIARFGQLIIQGGRFEDQQLLPAEWLALATSKQTDNSNREGGPDWQQGYGYQFWIARHGFRGDGAYGQFCVMLPELDAVVAITSASNDLQAVLDAVWDELLPGFADAPLPADPTAVAVLRQRLDQLALPTVGAADWRPPAVQEWTADQPLELTKIESVGNDEFLITVQGDQQSDGSSDSPRVDPGAGVGVPLTFRCGIGHWTDGVIDVDGAELPYAGSVSGSVDGALDAEISFLQAPHRLRIHRNTDGAVEIGWYTTPLAPPSPHLLATRPIDLPR